MKISNKEKVMLYILGLILVGVLYYNFGYSLQAAKIEEKLKAESDIKQKYITASETIKAIEDRKSNVKILKAKIGDESVPFYPTISEKHIIIELDKLLRDCELKGGISFKPIVSDSVEASKKDQSELAKSSLQGIVDNYNNITDKDKTVISDKDKSSNNNGVNQNSNNSNGNNSDNNNSKEKKNTIQYLKCEIKFEGNYEGLDKFLNTIDQNKKKIVVNSVKVSSDTLKGIRGIIDLEFYSIPKINDELEEYLKWDLNNTYGKSVPFISGLTSESTSGTGNKVTGVTTKESKSPSDFVASVKPMTSDLPTIMIGKANDDLRTTYVYADSNSAENAELVLTKVDGKYYYKYKTSKGTYPANYNSLGQEFAPLGKNIEFDILSKVRGDGNDNSSIKLKVINNTDKLLDVNITGEDYNNPRVTIDGDLSNISVNNK